MTAADLEPWRRVADPLADDALAALFELGAPPGPNLYAACEAGASRSPALAAFVEHVRAVEASADLDAIEAGRRLAMRHAPRTFLSLLAGALPETFAESRGAEVLLATGRLERDTIHRVYETASMIRDVLLPGGLKPGGKGSVAVVRVRLLHAWVRRHLKSHGFDEARYGVVVNQADMLYTLILFDRAIIRGISRLGGVVRADEDESWAALWRHVGRLSGVHDELIPPSAEAGFALWQSLRDGAVPGEAGRRLTLAVLDAFAGEPPFFLPRGAMHELCRRLLDDDAFADALGVGRFPSWQKVWALGAQGSSFVDKVGGLVPGAGWAGVGLGHAFVEVNRVRVLRWLEEARYELKTA